ncbi:MAG: zf-HC2 domain-containing protein [Candidatus Omnitrophica bacterium]|nr:zf-HC2 domain-containing protein [Candidatus Omnitrophota bacterium]
MRCKDFEKKVLDFIDDKTNILEKEKIEQHIEECEKCRNLYMDFIFILNMSKKIELPKLSEDYWKSSIKSIFEEKNSIKFLKVAYVAVSFFILFSITLFLMKSNIYFSKENVLINKLDLLNHELPFSEEEIIDNVDYMKEEEIENVLELVFESF